MIVLFLLASWHPCSSMADLGKLAEAKKEVACDGADIEIAYACHCKGPNPPQPWGATRTLVLSMPKTASVKSGDWVDVPFTLTSKAKTATSLDLTGGSVVMVQDVRQKGKVVPSPPCSTMELMPDTVRISVPAGGRVRGVMKWRATNHQGEGCADMTQNLPPGSYVVTFVSTGGEPKLTAAVTITVK